MNFSKLISLKIILKVTIFIQNYCLIWARHFTNKPEIFLNKPLLVSLHFLQLSIWSEMPLIKFLGIISELFTCGGVR